MDPRIPIDQAQIEAFCRKWRITEFSLFGSVLTDEFRPDSDVDVLVVYAPDHPRTIETYMEMLEELKSLFGRKVDLVEKELVNNPFRRHHILNHRQIIYAA